MKAAFISFFLLILCVIIANSQSQYNYYKYPQPGLMQGEIYHGNFTDPGDHNVSFKYLGDTVFKSLILNHYHFNLAQTNLSDFYTRYDSGKIYLRGGGLNTTEVLQYDFTLQVNDTFPSDILENPVVDSVSIITLMNGQKRKYLELSNNFPPFPLTFRWIDGIGDIDYGFFYQWGDKKGGFEIFVCQSDSTGTVYTNSSVTWNCDSLLAINPISGILHKAETVDFEITPNPTTGIIQITANNPQTIELKIEIIDFLGQIIINKQIYNETNAKIDLSTYDKGLYIIKISDGKKIGIKRVIKY